jgi:hypothetical protein
MLLAVSILFSIGMEACDTLSTCEEADEIIQNCHISYNTMGYDFSNYCDEYTKSRAKCIVHYGEEIVCSSLSGNTIEGTQDFNQCLTTGIIYDDENGNNNDNMETEDNTEEEEQTIPYCQKACQTVVDCEGGMPNLDQDNYPSLDLCASETISSTLACFLT